MLDSLRYQTRIRNFQHRLDAIGFQPKSFQGKTVLDLGCNTGLFCAQAAEWGATRVVGVDLDEAVLHTSRAVAALKGCNHVEFYPHDLGNGLPNLIEKVGLDKFDIVLCLSIFKYLDSQVLFDTINLYCRGRCFLELNPVRRGFDPEAFRSRVLEWLPPGTTCDLHGFCSDRRRRPVFYLDYLGLPSHLLQGRFRPRPDRKKIGIGFKVTEARRLPDEILHAYREGTRLIEEDEIFFVPTSELARFCRRRRLRSLPSWYVLPELGRRLSGAEKWSLLRRSLRDDGWSPSQPACLTVGTNRIRLANGHHRLAIAGELGIEEVPCCVLFR